MKTALLLIPDTNGSINRQSYISSCIQKVIADGFNPLTPAVYEHYIDIDINEFISSAITKPDMDTVFLFVDFGIDKIMFETIDKCVRNGVQLRYMRLQKPNLDSFFTTPLQILKDVSRRTGYTLAELTARTRKREVVDARFVYFRRAKEASKATLASIGLPVGKDHASVIHGISEAYNNPAVVKLYDKCYGETKVTPETLAGSQGPGTTPSDGRPNEGPILPLIPVESSEPSVPAEEPPMRTMHASGPYSAFSGYRPHNT